MTDLFLVCSSSPKKISRTYFIIGKPLERLNISNITFLIFFQCEMEDFEYNDIYL